MAKQHAILIVEDEDIIAEDIQETLTHYGYELVGRASSGDNAVELAREEQPDLILMDINLEGAMDGISAATVVKESLGIPVVYLTSLADDQTLERAKITEPYGYVLKPFNQMELRAAIELALHRSNGKAPAVEQNSFTEPEAGETRQTASEPVDTDIRSFLAKVAPFNVLNDGEIDTLSQHCRKESFDANEPIVFEGDESRNGLLVMEGRVAVIKSSSSGKELVVELLPPGDPFGLFPTIDKQPYSIMLKAQVDTKVVWVPRSAVMEVLDRHPEISRKLLEEVFNRLRSAHDLSRALAHDLVEVRVASALAAIAPKFCVEEQNAAGRDVLMVEMTRQELAEMIGSTSETVIRITKAMERDGILDLGKSGVIRILRLDQLKEMASAA